MRQLLEELSAGLIKGGLFWYSGIPNPGKYIYRRMEVRKFMFEPESGDGKPIFLSHYDVRCCIGDVPIIDASNPFTVTGMIAG